MTKFPNQEGLNRALNIYRSAMRSFIVSCLEKVDPKGLEDLIVGTLNDKEASKFEQELQLYKGNIEASIHINTFPHIIKNLWYEVFEQHFNPYSNIRSVISLIVDGRNQCAHLDTEDVNLDYTWTYLFLISDVFSQINRPDAKREIETILDELFPHDTDERIADMTKQLEAAKAEKTELEKRVKTTTDRLEEVEAERIASEERLETMSTQLKITGAGKTVAEERLSDISNQLEDVEIEKTELEKRLKTTSDRLKDVEREKDAYKKHIETISDQLATLRSVNAQLEERLETTSTQLEDVEAVLTACKEDITRTLRQSEGTKEGQNEQVEATQTSESGAEKKKKAPKPRVTFREKFAESTTEEKRIELANKVAELRLDPDATRAMAWEKICKHEEVMLKRDEFHKIIKVSNYYKGAVFKRLNKLIGEGWVYQGSLKKLCGFDVPKEFVKRMEANKVKVESNSDGDGDSEGEDSETSKDSDK